MEVKDLAEVCFVTTLQTSEILRFDIYLVHCSSASRISNTYQQIINSEQQALQLS